MNKELQQLKRDLEQPRPKGYEPFDKSAYCAFSWQAFALKRELQTQADEAERLYQLALTKYHAMQEVVQPLQVDQ